MTPETIVLIVISFIVGFLLRGGLDAVANQKKPNPILKAWRDGKPRFLGWWGEEPSNPQVRRKRRWPRKRNKAKTSPAYVAYQKWVVGQKLTPTQAWIHYADENKINPEDPDLKSNFLRAIHRYKEDD